MIDFQCSACGKKLRAAEDKAGRSAKCPKCGTRVTVPRPVSVESAESEFDEFDVVPDGDEMEPWSDFTRASSAPSSRRGAIGQITCPMCGMVNEGTTDRCLACGEMLDTAAGARGGTSLRFGDIWSRAWEVWSSNLGLHIAAILIAAGVVIGSLVLLYIILIVAVGIAMAIGSANPGRGLTVVAAILVCVGMGCAYAQYIVVIWLMQLGLSRFGVKSLRHSVPRLGDIFDFQGRLLVSIVGMFCYTIMYVFLAVLFSIPGWALAILGGGQMAQAGNNAGAGPEGIPAGFGLYLGGLILSTVLGLFASVVIWPIPYMLANRRSNQLASLIDGPTMALSNFKLSLLLGLVNIALFIVGYLACGIGLLFTYSLGYVLFAVAYQRCRSQFKQGT